MKRSGPTPDPQRFDWEKLTVRVTPELRAKYVEIAKALDVNYDGVAQLAIYAYCTARGRALPGWVCPTAGSRGAIRDSTVEDPKLWVRIAREWIPTLEALRAGEVRTWHGVVRESIREMHDLGRDAWTLDVSAAA